MGEPAVTAAAPATQTALSSPQFEELLIRADRAAVYGSLARGLAHDLRGPVQTLTLLADPHADLLGTLEGARIQKAVGSAVENLTETIERFSQVHAPPPETDPAPIVLGDVVAEVAELQEYQRGLPPAELELRITAKLPPARGLEAPIRHLLLGLVINAKQAFSEQEDGQLALTLDQADGALRIMVDDSGSGIPEADRERVFDLFYTTSPGRLGIGLTVARRLAEKQGGTLALVGSPLGGIRAVVTLPAWVRQAAG